MGRSLSLSWKAAFLPVRAASPDMTTYRRYAPVSGRRFDVKNDLGLGVFQPQYEFIPGAGFECQRNLPIGAHLVIDDALAAIRG